MSVNIDLPAGVETIQRFLPHRFPFLLVDRVLELEPGRRILAYKNVSINEAHFQGHFPTRAVMPGVLVIEAMAQAGGILTQVTSNTEVHNVSDRLSYLVKIDNARFSKMVVPGDRLDLEVQVKRIIRNMTLFQGSATVDGQMVACADILCAEVPH
jgi:3-hydroxyacyl-[acyl-carrier-protein] dehydratase